MSQPEAPADGLPTCDVPDRPSGVVVDPEKTAQRLADSAVAVLVGVLFITGLGWLWLAAEDV